MNSKKGYCLILLISFIPWAIYAQGMNDFYNKPLRQGNGFSLRAGINYSVPTVTVYYVNNIIPASILWGIRPNVGFYVGGSYYTDLTANRLSLRIDGTFRLKQIKTINPYNSYSQTSRYLHIGLSPMVGLHLTKRFTIYTGGEVNLMVINQNGFGNPSPIDIGSTMRLSYQLGQFKAEIGYYRGFTKYDQLDLMNSLPTGSTKNDFYNQTFEVGLIYNLK